MKYLYTNGRGYIYKRRIPRLNTFFTFPIKLSNKKKVRKVVITFNKISYNFFSELKGTDLALNNKEIYLILNDYKDRALEENTKFEKSRHKHFGDLFKITESDPILGNLKLDGGHPKVIEPALNSLKNLAAGDLIANKKIILSFGKDIIKRTTLDLKNLFSKIRTKENEEDLITFLAMLIKTESQLLQEDFLRASQRFGTQRAITNTNHLEPLINNELSTNHGYTSEGTVENELLETVYEEFYFFIMDILKKIVMIQKKCVPK